MNSKKLKSSKRNKNPKRTKNLKRNKSIKRNKRTKRNKRNKSIKRRHNMALAGNIEVEMKLQSPHFYTVKSGKKIYEMRPNVDKRRHWDVGTVIKVIPDGDIAGIEQEYRVQIIKRFHFDSFEMALKELGVENLLPDTFIDKIPVTNIAQGAQYYRQFPNYPEDEEKFRVVVWKLKN